MIDSAWAPVLDDLEAHLAELEAVAADPTHLDRFEGGVVPAFQPPEALGPVPLHLRARATELRHRMIEAELALEAALAGIRQDLAAAQRLGATADTASPTAHYIDTKA